MKSNTIKIDNHGSGFEALMNEVSKVSVYENISGKDAADLRLLTEEMQSLIKGLDSEVKANVWFECKEGKCEVILTTRTVLDKEERYRLLSSSTSGKNELANTFLGRVRDALEAALASEVDHEYKLIPQELAADLPAPDEEDTEWDGIERKIMRSKADSVKITIRGRRVKMVILKTYTAGQA